VSKRKGTNARVYLTERAIRDIARIEDYSIEQFGKTTAQRYLTDLEAAIKRIGEHPGLLTQSVDFHPSFQFYRAGTHLLVCDCQSTRIGILTLLHGSMDIPQRLSELEPTLRTEIELLHRKLQQSQA